MKHRHRLIFALFAVLLLGSAFCVRLMLTASADDSVILMVTGYRINEPKRETMPFFSGSQLYVPAEMFTELGLTCTVQPSMVILSNLKSGRILYFDVANGTASDGENTYRAAPVFKNGVCFLPFEFTGERLDLICRYRDAEPAPFARLSYPDDDIMADSAFLRYYASAAPPLLAAFQTGSQTALHTTTSAPPTGTVSGSVSGSAPVTVPPSTTVPPKVYTVYLVIDGLENAGETLDALRSLAIPAVFRITPFETEQYGALLRRIAAEGYGFVLAADEETTPQALDAANAELFAAARASARTALFAGGGLSADETLSARLTDAGYSLWSADFAFSSGSRAELAQAYAHLDDGGAAALLLPDTEAAAILPSLHRYLSGDSPVYARLSELCAPHEP